MKYLYIPIFCALVACGSNEPEKPKNIQWSKEKSSDFGKELAIEEELDIKLFLAQHKDWKTVKTGTGLQYWIYENGSGDSAVSGRVAMVNFKISLLDGTSCYETEKDELEKFIIDHSEIETGVQEGIKKMRVGDKAKFIMPSHLAHGLVGDMNKIPPLNPIVVDIYLKELR
jgi:FKBP-type peptidyl-prolyl cis-trans isomerase